MFTWLYTFLQYVIFSGGVLLHYHHVNNWLGLMTVVTIFVCSLYDTAIIFCCFLRCSCRWPVIEYLANLITVINWALTLIWILSILVSQLNDISSSVIIPVESQCLQMMLGDLIVVWGAPMWLQWKRWKATAPSPNCRIPSHPQES